MWKDKCKMVIEFLFNGIKDRSKLYSNEPLAINSPFDGQIETIPCTEYVGKAYCQSAIGNVKVKINGIKKYEYKGAKGRIANEVFELSSDFFTYTVSCTIDTCPSEKTRMLVKITSEYLNENENNTGDITASKTDDDSSKYDYVLEKLKLEVKAAFREDWESCVWIKDEQSEFLCSNLYPNIFRAENRLRAFANKVLIWELGTNWLNSPGLEKYAVSHKNLSVVFRSLEPAFSDIDDVFISTTLEKLFEIIENGIVYESPFQLTQEQFNDLIGLIAKVPKHENISRWVKNKRRIAKNLWKDIFEAYFTITENSQQKITDFILNRNHIAHNKPITWVAYEKMKKSFIDFDNMVKAANQKFEESVPSEELYLTMDIANEEARDKEEQKEYERNYLRDRIYGETGVEILWHEGIYSMFLEKTDAIYQIFYDIYYWDSRFTFSTMCTIEDNDTWQTLFEVKCNACEEYYIEVQIQMIIDDEMNSDSELALRCAIYKDKNTVKYTSNEDKPYAVIRYHNGDGYEDSLEGKIELSSASALDESEMDDFSDDLKVAIEELNPYISIKELLEIQAAKEGGISPVADFPCCECEQYGVSLQDDFYKFGHCCYCGTDNDVLICDRCESPFGDGGGKWGLCNSCLEYIEKE